MIHNGIIHNVHNLYDVHKGSELCKRSIEFWLQDNDKEIYSTYNEEKSVVAERFIRTLKRLVYKYMTSIPKNVSIDKLDDIVNNFHNTYHNTFKMKSVDTKSTTCVDFNKGNSKEDAKFKVADHVIISIYKNAFVKGHVPNWRE